MFKFAPVNHPPVRAVIWDLDGMVVQFREQQGAVSLTDLELLVQFILELSQKYQIAIMTRLPVETEPQPGFFDQYLLTLETRCSEDYQPALRQLNVPPSQSVVVGIDMQRLTNADRMGMQIIRFCNPRQVASELLPLLAEPLAA